MSYEVVNWRIDTSASKELLRPLPRTVTVVGAGALGAQICLEFTRNSHTLLERVTIVDPDTVQSKNRSSSEAWSLLSQTGSQDRADSQHGSGNYKSEYTADYLRLLAPQIDWISAPCEIAEIGWGDLLQADLIVSATDSVLSRMETAYAARMLAKPMLDAGVMGPGHVGGRVAVHAAHPDTACYGCGLSEGARAAVLEHLASPSLSCAALSSEVSMGTSPEGWVSAQAVAKHVAHLLAEGFDHTRSYAVRMHDDVTDTVELSVSQACPWHHQHELRALDDDQPIREALSHDEVMLLPWPMALTSACGACGSHEEVPVRLARLRNGMRCTRCGVAALQPVQIVERIGREDDLAKRTPQQLGLPKRNVLPVRKRIQPQRTLWNV